MSFEIELDQITESKAASPAEALSFLIRRNATGLVKFQKDKVLRQLQLQTGGLLAAASNLMPETPGGFLHAQGELSDEDFQTYKTKTSQEKKKSWTAISEIKQADATQVQEWKRTMVKSIVSSLLTIQEVKLSFKPASESKAPFILAKVDLALAISSVLNADSIPSRFPEMSLESVIVSQNIEPPESLSPEEKGLLTVAKNSKTIAEVFEGSFLEKDRIYQLLLTYYLGGFLDFESPEVAEERAHLSSLTPEDLETRQKVSDLHDDIQSKSFYEWLSLDPKADEEDVKKAIEAGVSWLSSPDLSGLFLANEARVVQECLDHCNQIQAILLSEQKRKEYDQFLQSGQKGSFLAQSLSLKEDAFLIDAQHFEKDRKLNEALAVLSKGLKALPNSFRILEAYIHFFCRFVKGNDPKAGPKVFAEIQRGTKLPKPTAGFLSASGAWLEKSGRVEDAKKFYIRALELDPHQLSARQAMEKMDPKGIAPILLKSFQIHMKEITFYDLLGVNRKAPRPEIQKAYRDCTKRFHPDRFYQSDDENLKVLAKDVYKRMVEAYMTLKNEKKREEYDEIVRAGMGQVEDERAGPVPVRAPIKSKEPQTPQGKKFYNMAVDALRSGNKSSAIMNLQLGLQVEPNCPVFQEKLAELQAK